MGEIDSLESIPGILKNLKIPPRFDLPACQATKAGGIYTGSAFHPYDDECQGKFHLLSAHGRGKYKEEGGSRARICKR